MEPVIEPNQQGTTRPSQVFGQALARAKQGWIVNIWSMAVQRAIDPRGRLQSGQGCVENASRG
jgi:hypothetical protein